jgi:hypothetical protein
MSEVRLSVLLQDSLKGMSLVPTTILIANEDKVNVE